MEGCDPANNKPLWQVGVRILALGGATRALLAVNEQGYLVGIADLMCG